MDLIQSNGQPHYGRFNALPQNIDVQKYQYKTPYGEVLEGWRKRLKYKKFKFCSIQHEYYTIGIAIAVPTSAADQPERAFNTCGIQKLKPQKPTIQRK